MSTKNPAHAVAAELRAELGPAPTPEELVGYHRDELDDATRRRVREYLALSPEAAEAVLDMARFGELEAAAGDEPYDVEAGWQRLREEIRQPAAVIEHSRSEPEPRSSASRWALAAALVTALGASFLLGRWTKEPEPLTHAATITLSTESHRGGEAEFLVVPQGTDSLVLSLTLDPEITAEAWWVEIFSQSGSSAEPLLSRPASRVEEGYFLLVVSPALLPAGRYEVVLLAVEADQRREKARYELQVATAAEAASS